MFGDGVKPTGIDCQLPTLVLLYPGQQYHQGTPCFTLAKLDYELLVPCLDRVQLVAAEITLYVGL